MAMRTVWKWALKLVEIRMMSEELQEINRGEVRESPKEHLGIKLKTLVPLTILQPGEGMETQGEMQVIQGVTPHILVAMEDFQMLNMWDNKMKMKRRMKMRK
jgi:hypothetical protein